MARWQHSRQLLRVTSALAAPFPDYQDTSTIAMTTYEGAVAGGNRQRFLL